MTNQSTRTVKLSDSHSVVHDGRRYEFRAKPPTVGDYQEWVRQVDDRDPRRRSVIADIDGNPPDHYPDEVVDACVGELGRYHDEMLSRFSVGLKDLGAGINVNLGLGLRTPVLGGVVPDELLGVVHGPQDLLVMHEPEERVIDAIRDLEDSLREERVPVARASLRWIRDRVLPGLIVLIVVLAIGWAVNEFFG